jgi:hypothetical protein
VRSFDFDKPSGVLDLIKTNRAPIQPVLLAMFRVGFFDAEIEKFKNALGGLVFNAGFDLHAGLLASVLARTLQSEHGDFSTVAA